jgi:hypothetical protein
MTGASIARTGFAILIGAILAIGSFGDVSAKAGKRHWHAHSAASRGQISGKPVQLVLQQPARLGPMRYFGGPKSPMWRGLVEN